MSDAIFSKWVAFWGNATSISDRKESVYAKNITLRYPVYCPFDGNKIRLHFSNLTGTEPVVLSKVFVSTERDGFKPYPVKYMKKNEFSIEPGSEIVSDTVEIDLKRDDELQVSIYLENYTQMNAGTLITGPLSKGKYAYGDFSESRDFPVDLSRNTSWFYFLNTIDIYTEEKNRALICYGDSITAQSWPDYLTIRCRENGFKNVSIIRRAVSGTRILRQYDCITYQAYGLKGETRFPIEMNVFGARDVIIQHGINDIIHPVGVDVNPFRPWSDMPSAEDLIEGVRKIYLSHAEKIGLKVWSGTLLPIMGWRTYNEERNEIRKKFNEWLKSSDEFNGCVDFDRAVCNPDNPDAFADGFDSGDHLHPSEKAYKAMADAVPESLLV